MKMLYRIVFLEEADILGKTITEINYHGVIFRRYPFLGYRKGAYATVWEVRQISDTFVKARISISHKNKETGKYEAEFEDFIAFSGSVAAKKAMSLHERDRIKIGDCDVKNKYDPEKKVKYYNFLVYSFELATGTQNPAPQEPASPQPEVDDGEVDDSKLPF